MRSAESLSQAIGDSPLPPVEEWNPDYCGELDLHLKADGRWLYGGQPFANSRLQRLFSKVLKKEEDDYFLVTPVEKLGIKVEWMPFVIVDFNWLEKDTGTVLQLIDNCDNQIELLEATQWQTSLYNSQDMPIVKIRRNLFASFSRSVYYQLVEASGFSQRNDIHQVLLRSNGIDFVLGEC